MRSLYVCGLVVLSLTCLSRLSDGATSKEWSLGGFNLRDKTIFSVFADLLRKHPEQIRHGILDDLVNRIADEEEREQYKVEMDNAIADTFANTGPPCSICVVLAKVVQIVIYVDGYKDFSDNLWDYCVVIFNALDPTQMNNGKEMCGVLTYQLPPIAAILDTMNATDDAKNRSTVYDICQTLNACYPPPRNVLMAPHALPQTQASAERPGRPSRVKRQEGTELVIAQITDVHIELNYAEGTNEQCALYVCCQSYQGNGTSKRYGSYECNIPTRTMELFIDNIIAIKPDIIIFSGDVPPHTMWDETKQSQLDCPTALTDTLKQKLAAAGLNIPVYPTLGNHEMYPTNLLSVEYAPDTPDMLKKFAAMWTDLANFTEDQIFTMESWGFYNINSSKFDNLRFLSINTDYLYTANYYNVINHKRNRIRPLGAVYEATEMKKRIEQILTDAQSAKEKVIIINHHPPGNGDYIISESKWYENLMVRFKDIIKLQVAGHTHTDEFRLLKDRNNVVQSMVYVSPSMDTSVMRNPSMRLYRLDRGAYELQNYEQHYLNIETSGTEKPEIIKLYDAISEYGLQDMTPASWENLLRRAFFPFQHKAPGKNLTRNRKLLSARFETEPKLLELHRKYSNAGADGDADGPGPCDESCKRAYICRQLHARYDHYGVCAAEPEQPTTVTQPPTFPPLIRPDNSAPGALRGVILPVIIASISWLLTL